MTDELLRERLFHLAAGPPTADWSEAQARGLRLRRKRRAKLAGMGAAVTALALAATPAFGLGGRVIDFFQSESAPEALKFQLAELNTGAPPGMAPGVDANQLRAVMTRELYNGSYTLWVAPTRDGGFCVQFVRVGRNRGGGGCLPGSLKMPIAPEFGQANEDAPILAFGSVSADGASQVEIEVDGGESVKTDLVWVTEPIDAGFYVTDIAEGEPTAVVVRNDEGDELSRLKLPGDFGPPG